LDSLDGASVWWQGTIETVLPSIPPALTVISGANGLPQEFFIKSLSTYSNLTQTDNKNVI